MKNILLFSAMLLFSFSAFAIEPGDNLPNTNVQSGDYFMNKKQVAQYGPIGGGPIGAVTPAEDMAKNIVISPNPATAYLDIKLTQSNDSKIEVGLYDMTGKLIKSSTEVVAGEKTIRITRDNFPSGVYFLTIKGADGQQCRKVIFS